jgi:hypothetical protein
VEQAKQVFVYLLEVFTGLFSLFSEILVEIDDTNQARRGSQQLEREEVPHQSRTPGACTSQTGGGIARTDSETWLKSGLLTWDVSMRVAISQATKLMRVD